MFFPEKFLKIIETEDEIMRVVAPEEIFIPGTIRKGSEHGYEFKMIGDVPGGGYDIYAFGFYKKWLNTNNLRHIRGEVTLRDLINERKKELGLI